MILLRPRPLGPELLKWILSRKGSSDKILSPFDIPLFKSCDPCSGLLKVIALKKILDFLFCSLLMVTVKTAHRKISCYRTWCNHNDSERRALCCSTNWDIWYICTLQTLKTTTPAKTLALVLEDLFWRSVKKNLVNFTLPLYWSNVIMIRWTIVSFYSFPSSCAMLFSSSSSSSSSPSSW